MAPALVGWNYSAVQNASVIPSREDGEGSRKKKLVTQMSLALRRQIR
jgi:hypothetical protein